MAKATWNEKLLAQSKETIELEGNIYFPENSVNKEFFSESQHTSVCPWKGTANYFNIIADGKTNENAAWYYSSPKDAASQIKGYIAFWKGVQVEK